MLSRIFSATTSIVDNLTGFVHATQSNISKVFSKDTEQYRLQKVLVDALTAPDHPDASFPALCVTKNGNYRVRNIILSDIDSDFAQAQRLTYQIVTKVLCKASQNQETSSILTTMQDFERKQLNAMHDMLPFIDHYSDLIRIECAKSDSTKISDLFFMLKKCIESQERLYSLDPQRKDQEGENAKKHYELFQIKIQSAIELRRIAENRFPQASIPILIDEQNFARLDTFAVALHHVNTYTPYENVLKAMKAQVDQKDVWDRLRYISHPIYFEVLCDELYRYSSLEEVPEHLMKALYSAPYIDMDELLDLPMFWSKPFPVWCFREKAVEIIEKCTALETFQIGKYGTRDFLSEHFIKMIQANAQTLTELSVSCTEIIDSDFESLPKMRLKKIYIGSTQITGECFAFPIFETIEEISAIGCKALLDGHVENCSTTSLKRANFSYTDLTGSCVKGNWCKSVADLSFSSCIKLQDQYVKELVSTCLTKFEARDTFLTGECFTSDSFKTVQYLDLVRASRLQDSFLSSLHTWQLTYLNFNWSSITGDFLTKGEFPLLTELDVSHTDITDAHLRNFKTPQLQKLAIRATRITGEGFSSVSFENLESLDVGSCSLLKDGHIRNLPGKKLKKLIADDANLNGTCLSSLCFRELEELDLSYSGYDRDIRASLSDTALSQLSSRKLLILDVSGRYNIDGSFLDSEPYKNLHILQMRGCKNITDRSFQTLTNQSVQYVNLSDTKITKACFDLPFFKNLVIAKIEYCFNISQEECTQLSARFKVLGRDRY